MSKKLIALLVIFFIAIGILIYAKFFYYNTPLPLDKPTSTLRTNDNNASLSIFPDSITVTATSSSELNVVLESQKKADVIQLELSYQPSSIYNLSIIPGNYFTAPVVILENIDYKNGRISYALKGTDINSDSNVIAVLKFDVAAYGVQNQSEISFLPKTLVRHEGSIIKLNSIKGAQVVFEPSFYPLPFSSTPSAILQ